METIEKLTQHRKQLEEEIDKIQQQIRKLKLKYNKKSAELIICDMQINRRKRKERVEEIKSNMTQEEIDAITHNPIQDEIDKLGL